ncbi:DUF2306 domain-containing protein [Colwellia sp. MEBiC06753]
MTEAVINSPLFGLQRANKTLDLSIKSWFTITFIGQWAFAFYILTIYTLTLANGLNVTDFSPAPNLKNADSTVRLMFFFHVIPAIYLSLFGISQLIPAIRNKYRVFHRWNGRIFLALGFTGALTGLFLQWSKGLQTNTAASLGISLNGLLILVAVFFTWRYATNKRFDLHQRWAIHTFFLVNGVWTFRLYLMGWYMVNQGPNGNSSNVDGPMDIFLSFACYLFPMAATEFYFWLKKQRTTSTIWSGSVVITIGALITLVGVSAAIIMMWYPRIAKVLATI